jgi:hypothetical protein
MENEKIKCYSMSMGNSKFVDTDVEGILEYLKVELQENCQDNETLEFKFGVEYYTQEEINKMPEFDGF